MKDELWGTAKRELHPSYLIIHPFPHAESKPQQTGTRLLPGHGEVATTSGSTSACGAMANGKWPIGHLAFSLCFGHPPFAIRAAHRPVVK